jgi:nucleoside-diphosphate-sugar epimerase
LRALVTGATGFVGGHLVERLLDAGMAVTCLVRETSDTSALAGLDVELRTAALDDASSLGRAVGGFDYVFHSAGLTRARTREPYFAVNAEGTARLADAVLAAGELPRRFVYVSSLAAAGPAPSAEPLTEDDEPRPRDHYGASKLAGEREALARADRMPVTIVRPPAVYGPRDTNFLPLFRSAMKLGRVPIVGRPSKQLAMVYVTDLAEGILRAAEAPQAAGRTYYVASGVHTMAEIVDAVCGALDMPSRRLRLPTLAALIAGEIGQLKWALTGKAQIVSRRKVRDMLQPFWICSWDRAREELGYREAVTLPEGMNQTVEWYFDQGWLRNRKT